MAETELKIIAKYCKESILEMQRVIDELAGMINKLAGKDTKDVKFTPPPILKELDRVLKEN